MRIITNNAVQTRFPLTKTCITCKSVIELVGTDIYFRPESGGGTVTGTKAWVCPCCGNQNTIEVIAGSVSENVTVPSFKPSDSEPIIASEYATS